jgi:hypothetical protein
MRGAAGRLAGCAATDGRVVIVVAAPYTAVADCRSVRQPATAVQGSRVEMPRARRSRLVPGGEARARAEDQAGRRPPARRLSARGGCARS